MTAQPEALRLADALADYTGCTLAQMDQAAAELRRLHAEAEESEALRERLSALLTSTAIALRGPAPKLGSWSWHDLPERAAALVAQRDALLEACQTLVNLPEDWIATLRLLRVAVEQARAAIKAVEEGK